MAPKRQRKQPRNAPPTVVADSPPNLVGGVPGDPQQFHPPERALGDGTAPPTGSARTKCPDEALSRDERWSRLRDTLLSPAVQVPVPAELDDVPASLSPEEVRQVFIAHVPGVQNLLFRQKPGAYALGFIQTCYRDGIRAFRGTSLHEHLLRCLRLVVHYGKDGGDHAPQYLAEVAEAFTDCQAVQARVVEQVGLRVRGIVADFRGLLAVLVGEYKTWAVQLLAAQHVAERGLREDPMPTHYTNRLTADLGDLLGLNAIDVRRALLDHLAAERFPPLPEADRPEAAARARGNFDVLAMLKAVVAEVNGFDEASPPNSLPRLFVDWAAQHLAEKHVVFDAETCTKVEVEDTLVLAVMEAVFLGQVLAPSSETYRGQTMRELFL